MVSFERELLFDIPYLVNWNKIGEYRQIQTDHNALCKNESRVDFDYAVGGHMMVREDGILCKAATKYTVLSVLLLHMQMEILGFRR